MITFHSRQSDSARRARKNENASKFQIHVTNCTTKSHGHVHEAQKIQCNNVSSWCNHKVQCYRFNEVQALPLVRTRFLRLANSSPKTARSPARRSSDSRETSGRTTGEISRVISAQRPGNGRTVATAMPLDGRADGLQDNLRAPDANSPCPRRKLARRLASNLNHDIQKL
jgi:hypothetical protein